MNFSIFLIMSKDCKHFFPSELFSIKIMMQFKIYYLYAGKSLKIEKKKTIFFFFFSFTVQMNEHVIEMFNRRLKEFKMLMNWLLAIIYIYTRAVEMFKYLLKCVIIVAGRHLKKKQQILNTI